MRVLLIDVGSKAPNLALMKVSAYHKSLGNVVGFNVGNPDMVKISCPYPRLRNVALGIATIFNGIDVEVGGYGVSNVQLPYEIEHIMPDYDLYNIDWSVGFTSRGCCNECGFCIVPRMEGKIRDHAPLSEFLHPKHKKLILYDNNFLASPKWRENLEELIDRKVKVSFNQGLDIRLVNDENAELLSKVRYYDDQFGNRRLYFSFDLPQIEDEVLEGVETLKRHGLPSRHLMFYCLVGFNTTIQQDLYRIKLVDDLGSLPYVMRYKRTKELNILARWVNGRYYKLFPFEKYNRKTMKEVA